MLIINLRAYPIYNHRSSVFGKDNRKNLITYGSRSIPKIILSDDAFFNRTGLERIGSRWAGLGQLLGWSVGSVAALPYIKGQE